MPLYKSSTGCMYKCYINIVNVVLNKKRTELGKAAFKLNFKEIKSLNNIKLSLTLKIFVSIQVFIVILIFLLLNDYIF